MNLKDYQKEYIKNNILESKDESIKNVLGGNELDKIINDTAIEEDTTLVLTDLNLYQVKSKQIVNTPNIDLTGKRKVFRIAYIVSIILVLITPFLFILRYTNYYESRGLVDLVDKFEHFKLHGPKGLVLGLILLAISFYYLHKKDEIRIKSKGTKHVYLSDVTDIGITKKKHPIYSRISKVILYFWISYIIYAFTFGNIHKGYIGDITNQINGLLNLIPINMIYTSWVLLAITLIISNKKSRKCLSINSNNGKFEYYFNIDEINKIDGFVKELNYTKNKIEERKKEEKEVEKHNLLKEIQLERLKEIENLKIKEIEEIEVIKEVEKVEEVENIEEAEEVEGVKDKSIVEGILLSNLENLVKYKELLDEGVITQEEFEGIKYKLLK